MYHQVITHFHDLNTELRIERWYTLYLSSTGEDDDCDLGATFCYINDEELTHAQYSRLPMAIKEAFFDMEERPWYYASIINELEDEEEYRDYD
jgi:hypothetical protein